MENKFKELGLSEDVLKAIDDMGFDTPSPIQEKAIPILFKDRDVIGQAQTGTGKTLAFGGYLLSKITSSRTKPQCIILSPTRELALQIEEELYRLSKYNRIKSTCVYGGSDINKQMRTIKKGVDIVVGTPGRVMDLMRRKVLKLDEVDYLVLDEADEMLNMGFIDDIETILKSTNGDRQTILFSATMPKAIENIAKKYMAHDYKHVKIQQTTTTADTVKQYYYEVKPKDRFEALCRIIDITDIKSGIIFCRTKRSVDEVSNHMLKAGYSVAPMHGDLSQNFRMNTLKKFKEGKINYLVATDVAARGIDVDGISHVINYELPQEVEGYVHRIGRTGRAKKEGIAYTIIAPSEKSFFRRIEKMTHSKIEKKSVPTIEEINSNKMGSLISKAEDIIYAGKQKQYKNLINEIDPERIHDFAAALLYMNSNSNNGFDYSNRKLDAVQNGSPNNKYTRMFITVGRMDKIQVPQIIDFLCKKAHITKRDIGDIAIKKAFTFVDINSKVANKVIKNCSKQKLNKRKVEVEVANRR